MQLSELHTALAGAMIDAHYQPIVQLLDRKPVALEALARLHHPTLGILLPMHFLRQMEHAGLAPRLTAVVARRAFGDMIGPSLAPHCLDMAINLPLDVLLNPEIVHMLDDACDVAGIATTQVIIELTESQPVNDLAALRRATERLRNSGYRLAIDDATPGMSHLDALLDLPFHGVKLDKGVVQQIDSAADMLAFAAHLIATAKQRGIVVIAEGVETAAAWERLTQLGVDLAQGYYVARPLVVSAVPTWLHRWANGCH